MYNKNNKYKWKEREKVKEVWNVVCVKNLLGTFTIKVIFKELFEDC